MISKSMAEALNTHMNFELYSANIYLSMSSAANEMGLKGAATWFMVQYQEEMVHFMKFFNYLVDQGSTSTLTAQGVPNKYKSLQECLRKPWPMNRSHQPINDLSELASKEKDHASQIFLQSL